MKILIHFIIEGEIIFFVGLIPVVTSKIDQSGTWRKKISYKDTKKLF